jgi:copper resistance protein B
MTAQHHGTDVVRQRVVGAVLLCLATVSFPAVAQEKGPLFYSVTLERLEYRFGDEGDVGAWDGDGVVGRDEWKLRLQSEGEYERDSSSFETLEHQLLLQIPVSEFFDAKAGVRFDTPKGPDRVFGVLGLQGLAPQWFEVDADLFLSERGDFSARLDADYELLLTNYLILTPGLEVDFAFSEDRAVGVGSGLNKIELGARLSYDLVDRSIAPYIGVHFEQLFGPTKRLARDDGEPADELFFVAGVRISF